MLIGIQSCGRPCDSLESLHIALPKEKDEVETLDA